MTDDSEQEHARVADEARGTAREAEERASAETDRISAEASTGEEPLRQLGLTYGGLIGVAVVMTQPFLVARNLDASARFCITAFAVAIPLLAALVLVNRQEVYRGRRTTSVIVMIAQSIAYLAAFVGIVAGFWHIMWVAGVTFFVAGLVAVGVHSAGFWRVESPRPPATAPGDRAGCGGRGGSRAAARERDHDAHVRPLVADRHTDYRVVITPAVLRREYAPMGGAVWLLPGNGSWPVPSGDIPARRPRSGMCRLGCENPVLDRSAA